MNVKHLVLAALTLVGAVQVNADPIYVDWPVDLTPSTSVLTRAEVLADYHVWRLSGLEELNRGESPPDTTSAAYRQAEARYHVLRSSTKFAELVRQIEDNPGATVAFKR